MESFDIGLELLPVDPPHPPAPDLDRRQAPTPHEGVHLRNAHVQIGRDVFMLVPVVFLIMPTVVVFALYPGLVALDLLVP
jgi:tight adherence protein C